MVEGSGRGLVQAHLADLADQVAATEFINIHHNFAQIEDHGRAP